MSESAYLGQSARLRLLELGGRSPSYQDVVDDEAENLRKRLLSGPTVDIFVGAEKKQWSLHHRLLCYHSTYFETEFEGHEVPRKHAPKDNKLELPDDDPIGFELLVKWLYQGQLEDTSGMSEEAKYDYAVACHKLYLLCDKFDMIRLKNIAMDQYRRCLNESQLVPDAEEINEIYWTSPVNSAFRSLMVKIAARQIMDPDVDRDAEAYSKCFENNPDFAIEMVNAVRYMSGGILFDDPTEGNFCAYHDHSDVSGCRVEGKSKSKARTQARAGATVNGQGSSRRQHITIPPVAELSAERRTPRKLNTPSKSAAKTGARSTSNVHALKPSANQSIPRQSVMDSNGDELPGPRSQLKLRSVPQKFDHRTPAGRPLGEKNSLERPVTTNGLPQNGSMSSSHTSPFDASSQTDPKSPDRKFRMSSLTDKDIMPNPTEASPSVTRSGAKRGQTTINGISAPPKISFDKTRYETKENGNLDAADTVSTADTESVASAPSRKRKFAGRTPGQAKKHLVDGLPPAKPSNTAPSRTGSIAGSTASGPRKLNQVSSIARNFDSNSQHGVGGKVGETRRAPPKLRLGSETKSNV